MRLAQNLGKQFIYLLMKKNARKNTPGYRVQRTMDHITPVIWTQGHLLRSATLVRLCCLPKNLHPYAAGYAVLRLNKILHWFFLYLFSDGQVRLPSPPDHPKELLCLWNRDVQFSGNEAEHFLARTRVYNNLLAFGYITSGTPDERPDRCAPIVIINGEIYHYITGCYYCFFFMQIF